jgi:hypothetical protein
MICSLEQLVQLAWLAHCGQAASRILNWKIVDLMKTLGTVKQKPWVVLTLDAAPLFSGLAWMASILTTATQWEVCIYLFVSPFTVSGISYMLTSFYKENWCCVGAVILDTGTVARVLDNCQSKFPVRDQVECNSALQWQDQAIVSHYWRPGTCPVLCFPDPCCLMP